MFEDTKLTKIESFQKEVRNRILGNKISNNFELLEYVYGQGHIPKHAADCLKELKKDEKITYEGKSPLVTYDNVYNKKKSKSITYKIIE